MKANINNLKQVLQLCAKAHNCEFNDWSEEGQFSLSSDTPATLCDVINIVDGFHGCHDTDVCYGHVVIYLYSDMDTDKPVVDMELIKLALPYGTDLSKLQ